MTVEKKRTLSGEEVAWIREALVIGLHAVGQVQKVAEYRDFAEKMGRPLPEEARVCSAWNDGGVASDFADALTVLGYD